MWLLSTSHIVLFVERGNLFPTWLYFPNQMKNSLQVGDICTFFYDVPGDIEVIYISSYCSAVCMQCPDTFSIHQLPGLCSGTWVEYFFNHVPVLVQDAARKQSKPVPWYFKLKAATPISPKSKSQMKDDMIQSLDLGILSYHGRLTLIIWYASDSRIRRYFLEVQTCVCWECLKITLTQLCFGLKWHAAKKIKTKQAVTRRLRRQTYFLPKEKHNSSPFLDIIPAFYPLKLSCVLNQGVTWQKNKTSMILFSFHWQLLSPNNSPMLSESRKIFFFSYLLNFIDMTVPWTI